MRSISVGEVRYVGAIAVGAQWSVDRIRIPDSTAGRWAFSSYGVQVIVKEFASEQLSCRGDVPQRPQVSQPSAATQQLVGYFATCVSAGFCGDRQNAAVIPTAESYGCGRGVFVRRQVFTIVKTGGSEGTYIGCSVTFQE